MNPINLLAVIVAAYFVSRSNWPTGLAFIAGACFMGVLYQFMDYLINWLADMEKEGKGEKNGQNRSKFSD